MNWARVMMKDLRSEARAREAFTAMMLVALVSLTVALLAFHDESGPEVASGALWLALSFAAALGLARTFGAEHDRGTASTLLTLPVERGVLYLGKMAASFVLLLVVAAVVVPAFVLIAGTPLGPSAWGLVPLFVLGALGFAATGTTLSALAAQTRGRDLLLPVLLFPLLVPLLVATVHGTHDVLHGEPFAQWRPELLLLAGYDLAFIAASVPLFEFAVEG